MRAPIFLVLCMLTGSVIEAAGVDGEVARVFGHAIYGEDLVEFEALAQHEDALPKEEFAAWLRKEGSDNLRGLMWRAVVSDYAVKRKIQPSPEEIDSYIKSQQRKRDAAKERRAEYRDLLTTELKAQGTDEFVRVQLLQHLNAINRLDMEQALIDIQRKEPANAVLWRNAERHVARVEAMEWKVNQALYKEFGGRVVVQEGGWEPIDAQRKVLEQYEARGTAVVHDKTVRAALYSYFQGDHRYAEDAQAKFYFEKPYWERTPQDWAAAGF